MKPGNRVIMPLMRRLRAREYGNESKTLFAAFSQNTFTLFRAPGRQREDKLSDNLAPTANGSRAGRPNVANRALSAYHAETKRGRKVVRPILSCVAAAAMIVAGSAVYGQQSSSSVSGASPAEPLSSRPPSAVARPFIDRAGVVHVPAFELPPSQLSSHEAQDLLKTRGRMGGGGALAGKDIAEMRRNQEKMLAPNLVAMQARYPVDIADSAIAGVPVKIVRPHAGAFDRARVLINLHGGGFAVCWQACAILESAPIASLGGYEVVTVNYRMAPEALHPAAVEDAASVYGELLKRYPAKHIGVYGCSAGGALTAELAAWLPAHNLPQAGAAGVFGSGGIRFESGDSAYIAGYIDGSFPPPPKPGEKPAPDGAHGYFVHADLADPIVSPALHPEVMAKFPPTLIITGTRALDMSEAIYTNSALIKAGVSSTLIVGEGMGHCYIYLQELPEARDAAKAVVAFFRHNLR